MTASSTTNIRHMPRTPVVLPPYDHWEEATAYERRGWCVLPLRPNAKKAQVRWKPYQEEPPASEQVSDWWKRWPDAGIALVLGPVSGVLSVDVDGPDAHAELVRRLGGEPVAPKILTGSGLPCRYQLLFRHPAGVATRSKITPWHPQLEFRGKGGLSVLPPSVHPSGRRYRWAVAQSSDELEVPTLPSKILDALLADAGGRGDYAAGTGAAVPVLQHRLDGVQRRALAFIAGRLTAVQGAGGDKATYTAACCLVKDFALSVEQALPVLKTWNRTNCRPAWADGELLHKLRTAAGSPGPRGRLLDTSPGHQTTTTDSPGVSMTGVGSGPTFLTAVPDWVESIWGAAAPCEPGKRRGRPRIANGILPLLMANVVLQRGSVVHLPDVALAQLVWGGDRAWWPRRWRAKLAERLGRKPLSDWFVVDPAPTPCPGDCPAAGTRHRHVRFRLVNEDALNDFMPFATDGSATSGFVYAFKGRRSHASDPEEAKANTKRIRQAVRRGDWCAIYLPVWVFGPRALPPGPCRVLKAATRELTRERGRNARRPDHAELVDGADHPLLADGWAYVGFNGNGSRKRPHFHGRGYSVGTWMKRAGYPHDPTAPSFRGSAMGFFTDLKELADTLGVVAAVRVPGRGGWLTAGEAMGEVGVVASNRLAKKCLVRLYAPADYPDAWRAFFASRLSLGGIPSGETDESETGMGTVATSEHLARWMKESGLDDSALAGELGVCRTLVCKFRTGARIPSRRFLKKLARFRRNAGGCDKTVPKPGRV